ncbi:MAG: ECF-type sigma factor [Longimicrobiales bacterium]
MTNVDDRSEEEEDPGAVLARLEEGDPTALDSLIPLVYEELKLLARGYLRRESSGHTLQTTALVNEAYVRMAGSHRISASNKTQFFGAASTAMRRVLVDYARKRKSQKRGAGADHLPLNAVQEFLGEREAEEVLALDQALDRLKDMSPRAATVVQHRFFGGLTLKQTAEILGLSSKTVMRDWESARAWLLREVSAQMTLLRSL